MGEIGSAKNNLFEIKKVKFLEAVRRASEVRGVNPPYINFEGDTCPGFRGPEVERAHIHVESKLICISKASLSTMTFEEIQETATHEVSHLFALGHGPDFTHQDVITKISSFTPPPGVVVVYPRSKADAEGTYCNHQQCKRIKGLKTCPHCEIYFCDKHLKPAVKTKGNGHECSALVEFAEVEGLKKQHLIDVHRFFTKVFNVHFNSFIAEYSTRKKSGKDVCAGVISYGGQHIHHDSLLTPLANTLKYG